MISDASRGHGAEDADVAEAFRLSMMQDDDVAFWPEVGGDAAAAAPPDAAGTEDNDPSAFDFCIRGQGLISKGLISKGAPACTPTARSRGIHEKIGQEVRVPPSLNLLNGLMAPGFLSCFDPTSAPIFLL
jgi:hypothetical protein